MHPAGIFVEALVDKKLPPGHSAVSVQPFITDNVNFAAKEKRGVRVDQQHRVAALGVLAGDGETVGSGGLPECHVMGCGRDFKRLTPAVKCLDATHIDGLDVPTDRALTEEHRHPGFETCQ